MEQMDKWMFAVIDEWMTGRQTYEQENQFFNFFLVDTKFYIIDFQ